MSTILVVDDDTLLLTMLREILEGEGHSVLQATTGEEALDRFARTPCDLVLLDMILPDLNGIEVLRFIKQGVPEVPVVIMTAYSGVQSAVDAMKAQAADYLCKPLDPEELKLQVRRLLDMAEQTQRLKRLTELQTGRQHASEFIGDSPATRTLRTLIERVAASEAPAVLVSGESGTGKELVAQSLHSISPRRGHSLVEVSCAEFSPSLFESELFGHERGAFTDAKVMKRGLAEVAHRGTLFLDEIGEMAFPLQAKLLRFLEDRRFRRVGGSQDISVDVRLVAATNRDLPAMVAAGTFRKDLYYRLNVIAIALPALRERPEDIPALAQYFLKEANRRFRKVIQGFTREAEQLLIAYAWPGNARELRNVVERIVLLESGETVGREHLPPEIAGDPQPTSSATGDVSGLFPASLDQVQDAYIAAVLRQLGGNRTKAAEILGITRRTLRARTNPSQ
jgi:two-component system response regulator HydG